MNGTDRYDGKPLLRLLELYVLRVIGELSPKQQDILAAMAPKLQAIYGCTGEWHEVIASAVGMTPDMPAAIRNAWAERIETAGAMSAAPDPQKFAEMFVDENLTA